MLAAEREVDPIFGILHPMFIQKVYVVKTKRHDESRTFVDLADFLAERNTRDVRT